MTDSDTYRPKDPWNRRSEESAKAYSAFEIYLELPPGQRIFKEAYRQHTGNRNAAAPSDHFKGWATRHDWEERALAYDDAKAKARRSGELAGVESQWKEIAAEKEKQYARLLKLGEAAYEKAMEIFAQELTKDNYSMAHAVQMSKFSLEVYRMLVELEKVHKEAAENTWTEEDERELNELAAALDDEQAREAAEFFDEQGRLKDAEELEEQRRRKKGGRDSEGNGDAST